MSNIAVGSKGKVNANSVNVRTDAGTGYNRVYYAQSGDIVVVQARKTGTDGNLWYKITNETHYTTSVGYIRNDFVDAYASGGGGSTSNINVGDTVITILPGVNFRSTPGGTSLFQVSTGTSMVVTAITVSGGYNWYKGVLSSKTGYLRGDCVEKSSGSGGSTSGGLTAGHYVKMNQSNSLPVNVRASTSTGSKLLGKLHKGTLMYCEEVVNSTWVKIRWGGKTQTYAYIQSQYLADGGTAASGKMGRAIDIGNSMADTGYPFESKIGNLDLDATQWCVQYLSWLMKASGCSSYPNFKTQAKASDAISFFGTSFGRRTDGKIPTEGDWVMYSKSGETYAHVGLIVKKDGNLLTTVEGNLSSTIKKVKDYNYNVGTGNFTVYGFATPSWS